MRYTPLEQKINDLTEIRLSDLGYRLVRVRFFAGNHRTLQIMIERLDDLPISLDDCTKVSHILSAIFDVEDVINGQYNLEVSSAGLERPLVKLSDFIKFVGRNAQIKTMQAVDGQKKFQGQIVEVEDPVIKILRNDGNIVTVNFDTIMTANLI